LARTRSQTSVAGAHPRVALCTNRLHGCRAYAMALTDNRRAAPQDDLTTVLVQAEVDGERLTSSEIASFVMLLAIAGNELLATRSPRAPQIELKQHSLGLADQRKRHH